MAASAPRRLSTAAPRSSSSQRGLSLVELLVATAVGLIVVAAASALVAREVGEHRALRREARLTQELRHAAEIVARDLRRTGWWRGAASGVGGDDGVAGAANPYAFVAASAVEATAIRVRYSRDAAENGVVDGNEQFGFRLRNGAIELQLGETNWQALTDPATVTVTAFTVASRVEETSLAAFCVEPCPTGSTVCPPRQQVVHLEIAVAGRSPDDAAVVRQVRAGARLRHTPIVGRCEG